MITCYFLFKAFLDIHMAEERITLSKINNWHSTTLRTLYVILIFVLAYVLYDITENPNYKSNFNNPIDTENIHFQTMKWGSTLIEDEYLEPIGLNNFKLSTILRNNMFINNKTFDLANNFYSSTYYNLTIEARDNSNFVLS